MPLRPTPSTLSRPNASVKTGGGHIDNWQILRRRFNPKRHFSEVDNIAGNQQSKVKRQPLLIDKGPVSAFAVADPVFILAGGSDYRMDATNGAMRQDKLKRWRPADPKIVGELPYFSFSVTSDST